MVEFHRLKMENLKQRLKNGEKVERCGFENGEYVVHLSKEPTIAFDDNVKDRADKIIKEFGQNTLQ